jgi:hypothetical protein
MRVRILGFVLPGAFIIALAGGCGKSGGSPDANSAPPKTLVLARVHWLGKDKLAGETNAVRFMKIWGEPESARIEAQTLDKLSLALARQGTGRGSSTNRLAGLRQLPMTNNYALLVSNEPSARLVRPLLDDLVDKELYLEIRQTGGRPAEMGLAIRLDDRRAALWQTNLAALATNSASASFVWQRSNGWTFVSMALPSATNSTPVPPALFFSQPPSPGTNWIEADLDLPRLTQLAAFSPLRPFGPFHQVSFTVTGDGENVRTRGEIVTPGPLPRSLEPWHIPTNLVRDPLISFTAARGVAPLLRGLPSPFSLSPSNEPNESFLWDVDGPPFGMFFALWARNVTNLFNQVAPALMGTINPRLGPAFGSISRETNATRLAWTGTAYFSPFLEVSTNTDSPVLFGGLGPHVMARIRPMPPELLEHIVQQTNLVYFDMEFTGKRIVHWRYLDDVYRIMSDAHGPRLGYTASLDWIATNLDNLSYAVTEVKAADTKRLTFARKSTVGLSALELDLLANWIELPEFPDGLSTLLATNPTPLRLPGKAGARMATNRPAAMPGASANR